MGRPGLSESLVAYEFVIIIIVAPSEDSEHFEFVEVIVTSNIFIVIYVPLVEVETRCDFVDNVGDEGSQQFPTLNKVDVVGAELGDH
jgi:hypothetical protein